MLNGVVMDDDGSNSGRDGRSRMLDGVVTAAQQRREGSLVTDFEGVTLNLCSLTAVVLCCLSYYCQCNKTTWKHFWHYFFYLYSV